METKNLEKDYMSPDCKVFDVKLDSCFLQNSPNPDAGGEMGGGQGED